MRTAGIALSILCTLFWVSAVTAQSAPDYDPNYLPFEPELTQIKECGVALRLDRSWPLSVTHGKDQNGQKTVKYDYNLNGDFWQREGRRYNNFTLNPIVSLRLSCNETALRPDSQFGLEWVVKKIRGTASENTAQKVGKISSFDAPGLGSIYYFPKQRKTQAGDTFIDMRLFALSGDRFFSIFLTMPVKAGRRGQNKKTGDVVDVVDHSTGDVIRVRLSTPAKLASEGYLIGVISREQQQLIIQTIFGSLRAL